MLLTLGGRPIDGAIDAIRRFCGLRWSGGPPETWAYVYYDATISSSGILDVPDVTATAALHPGLSRTDLAFFAEHLDELRGWLARLPMGVSLADAGETVVAYLATLSELSGPVTLALLSKVAHRVRPDLIPLVDRHVLDRYRFVTGQRSATAAWPRLVDSLRADLAAPANRAAFEEIREALATELVTRVPSDVRLADIAIWMAAR